MTTKLTEGGALRKNNKGEEALLILKDLLHLHPNDPDLNCQMALTCECMGSREKLYADFVDQVSRR